MQRGLGHLPWGQLGGRAGTCITLSRYGSNPAHCRLSIGCKAYRGVHTAVWLSENLDKVLVAA